MTCVWEPDPACLGDKWDELDEAVRERALMLATSSLINLTYGRVGTCPITVRPCPEVCPCACGDWRPVLWEGRWYNCSSCNAGRCEPTSEVDLPGPVGTIVALVIDGVAVAAPDSADGDMLGWDDISWDLTYDWSDFRIDEGHLLVWQGDGPSPIPSYQDLNKPLTEPGTWGVVYSQSYPVGADGRLAVAQLAMDFADACTPKKKCSLPRGVTNVARMGVSFTIDNSLFPGGLTGNDIVDQFILKWAPAGSPTRRPTVFDPRGKNYRRTSHNLPIGSL